MMRDTARREAAKKQADKSAERRAKLEERSGERPGTDLGCTKRTAGLNTHKGNVGESLCIAGPAYWG